MSGICRSLEARPVHLGLGPEEAVAAWPRDVALGVLWSGGVVCGRNRWTVLGALGPETEWPEGGLRDAGPGTLPFSGGWIGALEYEFGAEIEPRAGRGGGRARWWLCEDALVFDRAEGRWWAVGRPPELRRAERGSFVVGEIAPGGGDWGAARGAYEAGVARVLEYIRAGDVYQVNLTHRLCAPFEGSARAFFLALCAAAEPWYGAMVEAGDGVVCSASPELFLSFDPAAGRVVTRPMKGTRPRTAGREELALAAKDSAELNMITDLMRNDLGRVCELGSVRVDVAREVEAHAVGEAGLWQATATVSGLLRRGVDVRGLMAATFPGGSVTGAPKIRAMQIISELEREMRGVYCGAIGYVSRGGHAAFNVAIRTAAIAGGILRYGVGAGIVADSDPAAEWRETMDKAGVLMRAARAGVVGVVEVKGEVGATR